MNTPKYGSDLETKDGEFDPCTPPPHPPICNICFWKILSEISLINKSWSSLPNHFNLLNIYIFSMSQQMEFLSLDVLYTSVYSPVMLGKLIL